MLQVSTHKRAPLRGKAKLAAPKGRDNKAPPVIVAGATHPVYGSLAMDAEGLRRQPVFMLNNWHKKAIALQVEFIKTYSAKAADSSPYYDACYNAAWDTLEAAFEVPLRNGRDVAAVLEMIARKGGDCGDMEWLRLEQMQKLLAGALKATAPEQPSKRPGPFARGRKLTRAGLLFRYQSFLAQELMTIGWELYGNPNMALTYIPFDHEVTKRCSADFKDGKYHPRRPSRRKHHPFLDEAKLSVRARSVLGSLKIDTQRKAD